jgi:hypothetical protein
MTLNNCLFFAVLEALKKGKYIVIRKSYKDYYWPFCHYHFLVIPKEIIDKHAEAFVPEIEDLGSFPLPVFWGFINKGDK